MSEGEQTELAVEHLRQALETEAVHEKNYHVREAVQLLTIGVE